MRRADVAFATSERGGKARIVYTLSSTERGTLWERELAYRGPNLLFGILDRLRIRALMQADSAQRARQRQAPARGFALTVDSGSSSGSSMRLRSASAAASATVSTIVARLRRASSW